MAEQVFGAVGVSAGQAKLYCVDAVGAPHRPSLKRDSPSLTTRVVLLLAAAAAAAAAARAPVFPSPLTTCVPLLRQDFGETIVLESLEDIGESCVLVLRTPDGAPPPTAAPPPPPAPAPAPPPKQQQRPPAAAAATAVGPMRQPTWVDLVPSDVLPIGRRLAGNHHLSCWLNVMAVR